MQVAAAKAGRRIRGKQIALLFLVSFVLLNAVAFMHAYRFTHFTTAPLAKTEEPAALSAAQKLKTILFGVDNPRPASAEKPAQSYTAIKLKGEKELACWLLEAPEAKGTVVLFHGYGGQKASMLDKADIFLSLGYNALLVDFRGSGESEGNETTIGYREAADVQAAYTYLQQRKEQNIVLFGTSMGAVAVLKAVQEYGLQPHALILECPFGTTLQTVESRFRMMGIPAFPMAYLLAFWGGAQHGYNAFAHNPETYALRVTTPTLLLYGALDQKVSLAETQQIYQNLQGPKALKIYPLAGHENYLNKYRQEWTADVEGLLSRYATAEQVPAP